MILRYRFVVQSPLRTLRPHKRDLKGRGVPRRCSWRSQTTTDPRIWPLWSAVLPVKGMQRPGGGCRHGPRCSTVGGCASFHSPLCTSGKGRAGCAGSRSGRLMLCVSHRPSRPPRVRRISCDRHSHMVQELVCPPMPAHEWVCVNGSENQTLSLAYAPVVYPSVYATDICRLEASVRREVGFASADVWQVRGLVCADVTPFKCPTRSAIVCSCVLCWER